MSEKAVTSGLVDRQKDSGVLAEMVDTAESILHDYRHGFERVDDEGQCRDCGYRLYCG